MREISRGVVGGWGGRCGRCLYVDVSSRASEEMGTTYRRRGLSRS